MKSKFYALVLLLKFILFSCTNHTDKIIEPTQKFDCNSLTDKKVVFEIAQSIVDKNDNDLIWNLEIDTTIFFTTEDFFTNSKTKNRLILVGGSSGMSSGTANNFLILFSCSDSFNIIWSGQIGNFSQADISDLNGDGIKEIVVKSSTMWMGECSDSYNIFNFKDGKQNFLYSTFSSSVIDCGIENLSELFKQNDTLENKFNSSLLKINDKEYEIKQIHTIKIHNGGQTDDEISKNVTIISDTTNIKLK